MSFLRRSRGIITTPVAASPPPPPVPDTVFVTQECQEEEVSVASDRSTDVDRYLKQFERTTDVDEFPRTMEHQQRSVAPPPPPRPPHQSGNREELKGVIGVSSFTNANQAPPSPSEERQIEQLRQMLTNSNALTRPVIRDCPESETLTSRWKLLRFIRGYKGNLKEAEDA
jgi:hypothetical protein